MALIPYGRQDISDADVAAVAAALRDPYLTQGPGVLAFEQALAEAVGARYAVAVNSGTAALHAAYFAAGLGPGGSVLTSPISFVATANAALYLGAAARFADVDAEAIALDPGAVAAEPAADIRVLAPVHFGGAVAPMERLAAVAQQRGWRVVEDAAHALGARYTTADGQEHRVGACAHSDMCCFSFHPVKHITTGEGGAVTTNDPALYQALLLFRSHGITRDRARLHADDGPWYYEQQVLGFNYRITDVQCALGRSQLARLGDFVRRRRAIAAAYDAAFAGHPHIRPLREPSGSVGSYHLYVVRVPAASRRAIFEQLVADGLGVNVHYIPIPRQPYYRALGHDASRYPRAEAYYASAISVPMFPALTDDEQRFVIAALRRAVDGATA
jgi:UDP-4-amino-4,6-dideoxy-N-acetyl-beta-L-altrosamine transaminase